MELSYATFVLYHYGRRYVDRIGEVPEKRDLDPVLGETLLTTSGDIGSAIRFLDAWFDSPDPWYAREGFQLRRCFASMNRLLAQGDFEPKRPGSPDQQRLSRQLAVSLFLKPDLELAHPTKT